MSGNSPKPYEITDPLAGPSRGITVHIRPSGGADLDIEFNAFIDGALGKRFDSYDYPKDLKNQAAFEAQIKAIEGMFLPEPGSFAAAGTGPWEYETDNRTFGGGSHRVGFVGKVLRADIGSLAGKPAIFTHSTSGSTHSRWIHSGFFTSKDETGSIETETKFAAVTWSEDAHTDWPGPVHESRITTTGAAGYPFKAASPDIDYKLDFIFRKEVATIVKVNIKHNLFPFYELLINGTIVWKFTPSDTGPGVINLNRSTTESTPWLSF